MALNTLSAVRSPSRRLLEILVRKGQLKPGFESIIGGKSLTEVEQYLLEKKLVSTELLAKAFGDLYGLPFIRLVDRPIAPNTIRLLPLEIAKRYSVVVYRLDGLNLFLAIGDPARLAQNAPQVLVGLRRERGLKINLAVTLPEDVEAVLNKLDDQAKPLIPPAPAPPPQVQGPETPPPPPPPPAKHLVKQVEMVAKPIDLTSLTLKSEDLRKIPIDVARRYKMLVFEQVPKRGEYELPLIKLAAVNPEDHHVREIINYIEARNKVLVERYTVSVEGFETALKQYTDLDKSIPKVEKEQPVIREEKPVIPLEQPPSPPPSSPIEIPTVKTEIPQSTSKESTQPDERPSTMKFDEGISLSSADIISRPSASDSPEELKRLAREQESTLEDQDLDKLLQEPVTSVEILAKVFRSGVIPEIVAAMLFLGIRMKASDVHIEAQDNMVRLRYRIDGILHDVIRVPGFLLAPLTSRIKILSKMKIDEQRIPQDGRFDVVIDHRQVDLRVSTLPTVHGEKVVMRLLDKSSGVLTLEQLGVTGSNFDNLIANINKPYGVILSTGPTGSGKSTTLYAILSRISKPGVNIITLEDPVEYELSGINQSQVKPQIGFTFAEGLRSVLRQDPNVIMVGEIRDLETAAMATHAALTGHLVLSTLHTNDAAGALPRLINMGVEPFLITSSVNAVIGQRLVRKVCDKCRARTTIPPAILTFIKKELAAIPSTQMRHIDLDQLVFYHGTGCAECDNGYSGRFGIFEVLPMSDKIEELAVRKAPTSQIKHAAIAEGMITMTQDGLIKALKGITTVDEVIRVTTTEIKEVPGV